MALPKIIRAVNSIRLPVSKKTVKFQAFSVGNQKAIVEVKDGTPSVQFATIVEVLKECVLTRSFDPGNQALADVIFLYLAVHVLSVNDKVAVSVLCAECDTENIVNYDLKQIEVSKRDESVRIGQDAKGQEILIWPKVVTPNLLIDMIASGKDDIVDLIDRVTVGGIDEDLSGVSSEELTEFCMGGESDSIDKLTKSLDFTSGIIKADIKFTCEKCKKKNVVEVNEVRAFFN